MQLSGSRVFSEAFRVVKERFGPLLGIWAVYVAIMIAMLVVFGGALFGALMSGMATAMSGGGQGSPMSGMGAGMIAGIIVFYIALITLVLAQYASLSSMASPLHQRSFGDALKDGFRCIPTLVGVAVLLILAYIICAVAIALVAAALSAALGAVGGFLVIVLVLAAVFYAMSRLAVLLPVAAIERIGNPLTVISRTLTLTKGNAFKIFLINLVMVVIAVIVSGLSIAPMMNAMTQAQMSGAMPSFSSMGASFVLQIIAGIVMALFGSALVASIHAELAGDATQNLDDTFA